MPVPFARLFAVLLFLLAACGPNAAPATTSASPTSTAASSPAAFPATVSDFQDRSITIPKRPERIVSIGPSITELLFALGAGSRLVGPDDFSHEPAAATSLATGGGIQATVAKA